MTGAKRTKWRSFVLEGLMVFSGVFAAFLLDDWREKRALDARQHQIYAAIHKDLNRFHSAGTIENEKGFVRVFLQTEADLERAVSNRHLGRQMVLFGDYWNIEIIDSMMISGMLGDIDIHTFSRISRFHTIHRNMLMMIERFNNFYENNITANFGSDGSGLYDPESGELKAQYVSVLDYSRRITRFAELTVKLAAEIADDMEAQHLIDERDPTQPN